MGSKNSYFASVSAKNHEGNQEIHSVFNSYLTAHYTIEMYEIYSVLGVILVITGSVSSTYFAIQLKGSKYKKVCLNHLLDGLGTLFLGFFYIYSYFGLNESLKYPTTLTFQEETYLNVSEEPILNFFPATIATDFQSSIGYESSATVFSSTPPSTTENMEITTKTYSNGNATHKPIEEVTMIPLIDNLKNDSFSFYQNFFKDIINQKKSNSSANRTIFYNNKEYGKSLKNRSKIRRKRELFEYMDPHYKCFKRNFLKHALLICSFLYSVICLINNTKFYYKHKRSINATESKERMKEESISSKSTEDPQNTMFFEKNEKIGETQTKDIDENTTEKNTPNLDIFLAKPSNPTDGNIEKNTEEKPSDIYHSKHLSYILKLLIIWFTPGLCVFSLHIMMEGQISPNSSLHLDFAFNFTPEFNKNLLKSTNNLSISVPKEKSKEINNIVQNVYNIVKQTSRQHETKNKLNDGVMYDIIHHLNRKLHEKNEKNGCTFNTTSLKIHSFLLFFLFYVGSIFYCKLLEINMKNDNNVYTNFSKFHLYLYIVLWLPVMLDLFYRIYILNDNNPAVADSTLTLANFYVVCNNVGNYLFNKQMRKVCKTVQI